MTMKIDFTLVVQGINFFIGYLIIRNLLLSPAVKAIEADTAHKRTLNHTIETATLANGAADDRMKKHWQDFREAVKAKIPNLAAQGAKIDYSAQEITIKKINEDYANYLAGAVAKEIVERVEHVKS